MTDPIGVVLRVTPGDDAEIAGTRDFTSTSNFYLFSCNISVVTANKIDDWK